MKIFNIKPVINKKNYQINCSLPKKQLTEKEYSEIKKGRRIKLRLMGFE